MCNGEIKKTRGYLRLRNIRVYISDQKTTGVEAGITRRYLIQRYLSSGAGRAGGRPGNRGTEKRTVKREGDGAPPLPLPPIDVGPSVTVLSGFKARFHIAREFHIFPFAMLFIKRNAGA